MARRLSFLLLGSVWLALAAASAAGCSGDPFTPGTGGTGGTGGSTGSPSSSSGGAGGTGAGMSSSSSGAGGCTQDNDCAPPQSTGQCMQVAKCKSGQCALEFVQGPAKSQKYGDCFDAVCDENGQVTMVPNDADVYDDGNDCTDDLCKSGAPVNATKLNFQCGGDTSYCAILPGGTYPTCFECNPASADACGLTMACAKGKCVPPHCQNGVVDPGESGVDCGGLECNQCLPGLDCNNHSDCLSDVCTNGKCITPSCSDTHQNGAETDQDCGGNCPPCAANLHCIVPADCKSQVCMNNICQAPSCTDGTKNGMETGVDCGGNCDPCP